MTAFHDYIQAIKCVQQIMAGLHQEARLSILWKGVLSDIEI